MHKPFHPFTLLAPLVLGALSAMAGAGALTPVPGRTIEPEPPMTARAFLRESVLTRETREQNDPDSVPDGALRVRGRIEVSGFPALDHHAWRLPPDVTPRTLPRHPGFERLPDGGAYSARPILGGRGHQNFPSWGFFHLSARRHGHDENVSLLTGAPCIGAHAFEGDEWAAAELLFRQFFSADDCRLVAIRIRRIPGDPFLYMLISVAPADDLTSLAANFSGIPFASTPPKHAGWERAMWAMGEAWNMHDEAQSRRAAVTPDAETGVLWHNLGYGESAGMSLVFLPEEVSRVTAGGTWMVGATLQAEPPLLRVAMHEWEDFRGWRAGLETFREELPERIERLRALSFAWPMEDTLTPMERAEIARDQLQDLREALDDHDAALTALRASPLTDTPERFAAEREVLLLATDVRQRLAATRRVWLAAGGMVNEEVAP